MRLGRLFRVHGEFCASHPWEVIVALVTVTACILSLEKGSGDAAGSHQQAAADGGARMHPSPVSSCPSWRYGGRTVGDGLLHCEETDQNIIDIILMMVVRGSAILYVYYHFCNLQKLGSKYILGIAGLFTVFSSFIFTSTVLNFLGCEVSDLKDALFLFLLLIDLSKAGILAQLALCGANQSEVTRNIARGMEVLGPALSLDTLVETLVIGVGTLSGVQRLELLSGFAVLSALVNYVVFMTFYPACLSLILDLTHNGGSNRVQKCGGENLIRRVLFEEDHKPNPVVQRVKLIMSSGLFVVHVMSRYAIPDRESDTADHIIASHAHEHLAALNKTETNEISEFIMRWLSISLEQIVTYILIITLGVKFVLFDRHQLSDHLIMSVANEQAAVAAAAAAAVAAAADRRKESLHGQLTAASGASGVAPVTFTLAESVMLEEKATQSELSLIGKPERFVRKVRKQALVESDLSTTEDDDDDGEEAELLEEDDMEREPRPLEECVRLLQEEGGGKALTDAELEMVVRAGRGICPLYKIETIIGDAERGVRLRRNIMLKDAGRSVGTLNDLPYLNYDYAKVMNACCENVLGYVPIPVGYAGPLLLDGQRYYVPMATTEGALVASTNRGCKAISTSGVTSFVEDIGMTRAPCVRFPNVLLAAQAKRWMESEDNFKRIKKSFDSTSRYARLQDLHIAIDGPVLYIRFRAFTGDAMGMNMLSKGTERALRDIQAVFPEMVIISLSGNFCSDKKPAAINWIKGRGKRVVCESIIPADKLETIFKTNARTLVQCNKLKNMTGSAIAGSIGGNNAHAANMVTAIYIATGQDPAQNVTSSNCSTNMETCGETGEDLYVTCTMPSLEVGTLGGGTGLPGQGACLDMLGVRGSHPTHPAENAKQLARIICATVMAGELSLLAALVTSDLVKSHMRHNRSSVAVNPNVVPPAIAVNGSLASPSSASNHH
ncbi:3-hydroxy-3-methylglutaryl-coenzyme A reductase [Anopheles bellator]|uniref:3-hydroxy-3-methylglutaryl-coenzyme A reductase n=1 Tax=Anopheles bellator TaxID=139047 RepID=UPI002647F903|nr:3-hydroxy-3-methylglutaryl-coenzyme A reductase [Anopheles bellator]